MVLAGSMLAGRGHEGAVKVVLSQRGFVVHEFGEWIAPDEEFDLWKLIELARDLYCDDLEVSSEPC